MDSNRRHKLSENTLAKWFSTQYDEWIAPNSGLLSTIVLVILLVMCAVMMTYRYMEWTKASAWKKYYAVFGEENPQDGLEALAETAKEPVLSQVRLTLAQLLLSEGCNLVFTDKEKAISQLDKAMQQFQRLQKDTPSDTMKQQASFGLAQTLETLAAIRSGSDLAEAEMEYKTIADRWPDSYYGKRAGKQLAFVSLPGTKNFLERAVAKAAEQPKAEDFKVEIDTKDPFMDGPKGFDAEKALGGGDSSTSTDPPPATETKPEESKKEEPKKEEVTPEEKTEPKKNNEGGEEKAEEEKK